MPDSLETQVARIEERQKSMDEKMDLIFENQKEFRKEIEEFHTFKGKLTVWGSVFIVGITAGFNWFFKQLGGK